MTVIIIFLFTISLWYLSGFLPNRLLKTERNHWHFVGIGKKALFAIDGDKAFAWIPLPWPFHVIPMPLRWPEYVKADRKYEDEKTFIQVEKRIGYRNEIVPSLLKLEIHPYVVEVTLKNSGVKIAIIFDVILHIFNPMKIWKLKNFLLYAENEYSDVVTPWAVPKEFDEILELRIDEPGQITVPHHGTTYNLPDYLDQFKFRTYGFEIAEQSAKLGIHPDSKKFLELRQKAEEEKRMQGVLDETEKRRQKEREIFMKDADTEREVQEKDLAVTKTYQEDMIKKIGDAQSNIAYSYQADTLVIANNAGDDALQSVAKLTSQITANLVTHKRLPPLKTGGLDDESKPTKK